MENKYTGNDRRRSKRIKVPSLIVFYRKDEPLEVRVRTLEKESQASMIDISEGGVSILSEVNMVVGTNISIRFTLSKIEKESVGFFGRIEVAGEVRNSVLVEKDSYRVGIAFINLDEVSKREIANFVQVFESQ